MKAIEVKNLKKHFGKVRAVDGISFDVKEGEIFGFLGPNGAGKTTAIRCMMDFIRPEGGKIKIQGLDAQKDSVKINEKVGFIAGDVHLFENWKGRDHIELLESINGKSEFKDELIERLQFDPKRKVREYSSGNKQKLALILSLMKKPHLLILDEPTVGLDPLLQNEIHKILGELNGEGTTIFLSSHNLAEVEKICHKVAIIKEGKILTIDEIEDLKLKAIYQVRLIFKEKVKKNEFRLPGIKIVSSFDSEINLSVRGDINQLLEKVTKYKLKDIVISRASLDEIFLEYYEK